MLKLFIANLKMTFRDKQAIFWTLVFPVMFIVIFGLFNFDNIGSSKIVLIDRAKTVESQQFKDGLSKVQFLKINEDIKSEEEARQQLKDGKIDFVLIVPEEFKAPAAAEGQQMIKGAPPEIPKVPIKIYFDQGNATVNQLVMGVLQQFISHLNLQFQGAQDLFTLEEEGIQAKSVKYLDILMPGILAMAVMSSAIIGLSSEISKYREQKLLKRLYATPLKIRNFLAAEVLSYLVVAVIQVTLIILVAQLIFKVQVFGSYLLIYLLCIFGSLVFLNIGFAIGGYAKSVNTAGALSQIIFMPMMFFSGVFFSTEALPKVVAKIVQFLPLTPLIEALRAVSINEAGLVDIATKLLFLAGWFIISFLLAWKLFKFKS